MTEVTLGSGWRFAFGPHEGAERDAFAASAWNAVALPHTWNAQDAFSDRPTFCEGAGWYRLHVPLEAALQGKRLILRFEGANQVADVWWNGTHVGQHAGGYTAFAFDVTDAARLGADNLLAVRVDNTVGPVPPLMADYDFYGGLYRPVRLLVLEPVHLSRLDHGAPGAWAEGVDVSEARAGVRVHGRIANRSGAAARIEVVAHVRAPDGHRVLAQAATLDLAADEDTVFALPADVIDHPHLWSPGSPALYSVHVELRMGGHVVDSTTTPLGLRWFAVDPERGFMLNGQPLRLNGTNRHQDRAGLGNAVPGALQREDIRRIKADGFDFVRLAHYPQCEDVLDECDRQGLVVWEEIPVVNLIDTTAAFEVNARNMLLEMIGQHRIHPCVCFWGLANEVLLIKPPVRPADYPTRVERLVRGLNDLAHATDPSRLTAAAVSFDEIDDGSRVQDVPDVLGLNLYFGWYYRSLPDLGPWLDGFHAKHPTRPVVISEFGADGDERVHSLDPTGIRFSTEYEQRFHEQTFPQLAARSWIVGTAVWNQFDFGSRHRDDTKPNLNKKGLYFFDRTPKDVAFYYRAQLAREPVLHIATRDWPSRAGSRPGDERQQVTVYSNLAEVTLWQGERSLGARRVANGLARWDVTLQSGVNAFIARGARGARDGRAIEDRSEVRYQDRSQARLRTLAPRAVVAVNASQRQYRDAGGTAWEKCRPYEAGSFGHVGGEMRIVLHRIYGTTDDALFQCSLEGVSELRFDVPDGDYTLELRFAETLDKQPGERVFDVSANGEPLCAALDLAATAGAYVAVTKTARVHCAGGHGLEVAFRAIHGNATVSAAKLTRL